jgi:hypothetical protein
MAARELGWTRFLHKPVSFDALQLLFDECDTTPPV